MTWTWGWKCLGGTRVCSYRRSGPGGGSRRGFLLPKSAVKALKAGNGDCRNTFWTSEYPPARGWTGPRTGSSSPEAHVPTIAEGTVIRLGSALVLVALIELMGPIAPVYATALDLSLFVGVRVPYREPYSRAHGAEPELALDASLGGKHWPLLIALYLAASYDEHKATVWPPGEDFLSGKHEVTTLELGAGVRKIWAGGGFRPHVAGGLAFGHVDVQAKVFSYESSSQASGWGPWVAGGGSWPIGTSWNLGFAGRYSTIGGNSSAGGTHLGLALGWSRGTAR